MGAKPTKTPHRYRCVRPLLAAAVLAAACGGEHRPPARQAAPTSAPASPGCPGSGVVVTPAGIEAAMGLRVLRLESVNCGGAPLTLHGYPAIRVLDADREMLDVEVGKGSSTISTVKSLEGAPRPVRLEPGDTAAAFVLWKNTYTDTSEPPVQGVYLDVVPAPGQAGQTVRPSGGIDLGSTGKVGVTPWRRPQPPAPTRPPS